MCPPWRRRARRLPASGRLRPNSQGVATPEGARMIIAPTVPRRWPDKTDDLPGRPRPRSWVRSHRARPSMCRCPPRAGGSGGAFALRAVARATNRQVGPPPPARKRRVRDRLRDRTDTREAVSGASGARHTRSPRRGASASGPNGQVGRAFPRRARPEVASGTSPYSGRRLPDASTRRPPRRLGG